MCALKTIVAFANTAGGPLLAGVEDNSPHVRGVSAPEPPQDRSAGYSEAQVLYLILAIAVKKAMSNHSNHLFDTPVDGIFKAREWNAVRVAQASHSRMDSGAR